MRESNLYQKEALKEIIKSREQGLDKGLVILPTGCGKTYVAAKDAKDTSFKKILYVAHVKEILDNAKNEFLFEFEKNELTNFSQNTNSMKKSRVVFSTIQILSKFKTFKKLPEDYFDYIVIDEFHHSAAETYLRILDHFKPKFLLGLTATPFRGDKKPILELCNGNVIIEINQRQGIEQGLLSPYHYYGCFDDIDYSKIRHKGVRYDINDLNKSLMINTRDNAIIRKYKELANNKKALGFCCSHLHAKRCNKIFNEAGIKSSYILSNTPFKEREKTIKDFEDGKVSCIFTVDIFNEGVNFPDVECLLFLRPTESKRIFIQQLGRGLRKAPNKDFVIAIDFIGNFINAHRLFEYQQLDDEMDPVRPLINMWKRNAKDILNLPLNCKVNFEEKVIDIFAKQIVEGIGINRYNIASILIYNFLKQKKLLNRIPTKKDIDRYSILDSGIYKMVFNSWKNFVDNVIVEYINGDEG